MEKNSNLLEVHDLSISFSVYGKITKVIDNISFSVGKGQRVGLVGESGCGKTTTLRAILNVLPSNAIVKSGEILFNGSDVFKMPEKELQQFRRTGAGMIFQDPSSALNPVFTIGDQLTTALKYASNEKMDKAAIYNQVKGALRDVYLADPERIMNSYPFQLSGGMKQRVCIAVTLAAGRNLLLADEPGTSLDVTIQDQILRLINKLVLDKHLSVIMVSHSLGVIREVTSFVNIMYAGTIVESGDTNMVFQQPKHPYTISLMNCVPKLTGEGIAEGVPGRIPDYANPPLGCRFSPRCPYAKEICHKEKPPKIEVGPNHLVSCYFANEVK
ncbi:MAG: ABC transporter ATP-binding protein [Dehalobacterium sp.]